VPVRNDVSWRKLVSGMTGRESASLVGDELELTIFAGFSTVQSSRLETVAFLCLQRLTPRSNKSSSRLENRVRGLRPATCGPRSGTVITSRTNTADGAAKLGRESFSPICDGTPSLVPSFVRPSRAGRVMTLIGLSGRTETVRSLSDCPSPNLSKIITNLR
jgi:hypothetical protein